MSKSKKIIVTIGPSISAIDQIHHENYIYRINGAHSDSTTIKYSIKKIREKIKGAKILVDLPGNKIRTNNLNSHIEVKNGEEFFCVILSNPGKISSLMTRTPCLQSKKCHFLYQYCVLAETRIFGIQKDAFSSEANFCLSRLHN